MKLENEIFQPKFKSEYQKAALNIIYTCNWFTSQHSAKLKPHGITQQQYNILRILRGQHPKPASIKLLKERMMDKMSDASRLVEKLRIKGLIDRKVCKADRRNVDVIINEKGLELLKSLDYLDDNFKQLIALNDEEVKQLNDLLDKLRG
ncbi:MAG: Transcriptional regulator SlyA [Bacteroidia bacterium]|nr:Transcriptional regulator SlyA [Bacteroidia bacterium]